MAEAPKNREEQRILLHNVSWGTYGRLLAEREERRSPRFFYDRGVLEIMSPSAEHDRISRIVAALVELLTEELDIDVESVGSRRRSRGKTSSEASSRTSAFSLARTPSACAKPLRVGETWISTRTTRRRTWWWKCI